LRFHRSSDLIESGNKPVLVVSQPDAKRDRGEKIKPTPVKEVAIAYGIPVAQPDRIRGNVEFIKMLAGLEPELIVVAAYGKILPKEILELPAKGCVNIHGSLLPKYRGAAPVQWAILEGETKTGITLMQMAAGMDTGDMLASASTDTDGKTTAMLLSELSEMGANLLVDMLPRIEKGQVDKVPQDDAQATYAPMIKKSDGLIDFSKPAVAIERQIRAMNPWPGAYTTYDGQQMKLWKATINDGKSPDFPGTIISVSQNGLMVATGDGLLNIEEIQMPGKKKMTVGDYIRGNNIEINRVLG
jgi:methionyl-tRNA formyltransferase